jgi:cytochrome c5
MGGSLRKILFHGAVVLALACAPCLAQAEGWKLGGKELHPWIIIQEPGISSAWKKAVSSAQVPKNEQFWVQDMGGPGSADIVTGAGGRKLVVGKTCRPHDCHDNNLVFAIDLANKQIWALRQGRGQSPKAKQFIGGPDAEMQQLLLQELAKEFPD